MYDLVVEYLSGIQEALGSRPPTPNSQAKNQNTTTIKTKTVSLMVEIALEGITFN